MDLISLVFVLSTISKEGQIQVIKNIRQLLKPKGSVIVRDYGANDQLNIIIVKFSGIVFRKIFPEYIFPEFSEYVSGINFGFFSESIFSSNKIPKFSGKFRRIFLKAIPENCLGNFRRFSGISENFPVFSKQIFSSNPEFPELP